MRWRRGTCATGRAEVAPPLALETSDMAAWMPMWMLRHAAGVALPGVREGACCLALPRRAPSCKTTPRGKRRRAWGEGSAMA